MIENNKVEVVVVTYNRKRLLMRCLEALMKQTVKLHRVIVVDNASTDGTNDIMDDYLRRYHGVIEYIRLDSNTGGSGGFAAGFQHALLTPDWDWLMVMDDDAAPEPAYTEKLLKQAEMHPSVKSLIGTEYVGDTEQIAFGGRRVIDKKRTMRTCIVPKSAYKKSEFWVDTAVFVGLMMHKDVVTRAGCPDTSFFIYYDDTDYCFRIRKYTRILHVTDARIVHRENYEKDVMEEGQVLWRQFYLYRNEVLIKKRYIQNPFVRYGWIFKNYFRAIKEIMKGKDQKRRRIVLITHATFDVLVNRLGKVDYLDV